MRMKMKIAIVSCDKFYELKLTGRVKEVCPNNRATCKNKACKDDKVRIVRGELRFGTLVTIEDHTSWAYKHW